jgi:periplasmic copper chaperone A
LVRRLLTVLLGVFAACLALAAPALAHVTVSSDNAVPGGYAQLTFAVPDESAKASTVGLAVELPDFAQVLVQPKPGWSFATTMARLTKPITDDDGNQITSVVREVRWKAAAGGIKPGSFDTFTLSVGPLPKARSVAFGAVQTYSDGKVVRWNQVAAPGSTAEPDFPKPTLRLSPLSDPTSTSPAAVATTSASNTGVLILAIVALVVAAAALGLAVVGNARRRST